MQTLSNLKPCLIGIEAWTGSNYWARTFISLGHEVQIMAPQFVKPYVMSNKNDMNDAKGIAKTKTCAITANTILVIKQIDFH